MKKFHIAMFFGIVVSGIALFAFFRTTMMSASGAPPYVIEDLEPPETVDPYAWIKDWKRPEGPPRVGLQIGHWKNDELPEELHRLIGSTGSSGRGKSESEVNLAIAEETKKMLDPLGIIVDLLPATIPPQYTADLFISIHADGSVDRSVSGYKVAAPRRDYTQKARTFVQLLEREYENATGLVKDSNVSRNMTGYYAFAWWRYDHAVHPMTPSVILETGFLTSPTDQKIIVDSPEKSAQGIANAVVSFLRSENLLAEASE